MGSILPTFEILVIKCAWKNTLNFIPCDNLYSDKVNVSTGLIKYTNNVAIIPALSEAMTGLDCNSKHTAKHYQ